MINLFWWIYKNNSYCNKWMPALSSFDLIVPTTGKHLFKWGQWIENDYGLSFSMSKTEDADDKFVVRLCRDVLLEALIFGDRRRLTKLERVNRRLHLIIEYFFKQGPFLRLGLKLNSRFFYPLFFVFYKGNINNFPKWEENKIVYKSYLQLF